MEKFSCSYKLEYAQSFTGKMCNIIMYRRDNPGKIEMCLHPDFSSILCILITAAKSVMGQDTTIQKHENVWYRHSQPEVSFEARGNNYCI